MLLILPALGPEPGEYQHWNSGSLAQPFLASRPFFRSRQYSFLSATRQRRLGESSTVVYILKRCSVLDLASQAPMQSRKVFEREKYGNKTIIHGSNRRRSSALQANLKRLDCNTSLFRSRLCFAGIRLGIVSAVVALIELPASRVKK